MATSNRNLVIGEYFERFVTDQVARGRFNNSSEVLRAGLRMLEEHEMTLREQRSIVQLKEADAKVGMSTVSPQAAAQVTQSVSDAMQALAASKGENQAPVLPVTKGLLRPQIAAE